jgi:hypothetical protein
MGGSAGNTPGIERWRGQGPDTPVAPSTKFMTWLCRFPATALTWYSPGATKGPVPPQPGDEALRSQ